MLKKFGKALLTGVLSAGVVFGVSSCVQSYTTGYLYVTGNVTAQPDGNGIISGFRIDHNTGELYPINTLPVSSGGANPVRAVLTDNSRFLYVLNRGVNAQGNSDCYGTDSTTTACLNSSITQFAVGGNGSLTFQETFYSQGLNPFRMITDSTGSFLLVLDHDAPGNVGCSYIGKSSCGDVTVFQINSTTGRLSLVENAQQTSGNGPLTYFPVPPNPVDFAMSSASTYLLTLVSGTPATGYPYTGGTSVFPYVYTGSSGQLTVSANPTQSLGITQGTAIVNTANNLYVLDNEPPVGSTTATSQILPFTIGAGGYLEAETGGNVPDDATLSNPIQLLVESKSKFLYVANQGNETLGVNAESGIAGYFITTNPTYQLTFISGEPFGSGAGPQCIVEDPSDQYIYTANLYSSNVTGRILDPNAGVLDNLRVSSAYTLQGPATWCVIDGRTG